MKNNIKVINYNCKSNAIIKFEQSGNDFYIEEILKKVL